MESPGQSAQPESAIQQNRGRWTDPNMFVAAGTIFLVLIGFLALWISRDAEHRQLRAYVYIDPIFSDISSGSKLFSSITLKNGGQTPAYDFSVTLNQDLFAFPQDKSLGGTGSKPPQALAHGEGVGDFVYQSHEMNLSFPQRPTIDSETFKALVAGTKRVFIWGRAEYSDAFRQRHYVDFCFSKGAVVGDPAVWNYCVDDNDAN